MTLRLILMRHAKSCWTDPLADDHDRVLNARGRKAAQDLGDWLRAGGYLPDLALCSTAMRTRETLERLELDCPTNYEPDLYHAPAGQILTVLQSATANPVILLGHNPGIGDFAARILRDPPRDEDFMAFPTGATLVVDFAATTWAKVGWAKGTMVDFALPRALATQSQSA